MHSLRRKSQITMTQFRYRTKTAAYHVNSMRSSLIALPNPPANWEDFWDFTRMSKPRNKLVLYKRLTSGSSRFMGNYLCIFLFILLSAGIFGDYRFLLTLLVLTSIWTIICAATEIEDFYRQKSQKEYIISLNERLMLLIALSHLVLFIFKCLKELYMVLIFTIIFSTIHCCFRPVTRELEKPKTKIVSSDGFVDEINKGEEEISFINMNSNSNQSQVTSTLKHRTK